MKKILAIMSLAAVSAMAISASRLGPVSTYGELKANGSKLSGSCPDYADKAVQMGYKTVVLQSGEDEFYNAKKLADIVKEIKLVPNSDQLIRVTLQKKNSEIINDECKAKISSNNDRDGFFISIRSCKLDGNSEFTFKVNWDNLDIKRNSIGRY